MRERPRFEFFRFEIVLAVVLLCFFAPAALAEDPPVEVPSYNVGDTMDSFELEDQFGKKRAVDGETKVLVFSRDMDGGDLLKSALKGSSEEFMSEQGIVYVADIHGMPGVVSNLFAKPAMRRRGYPMLLDRDGETTARLPDLAGRATLIRLKGLRIERLEYLDSEERIRSALGR